jgi:replication-associated recombination protein RarA
VQLKTPNGYDFFEAASALQKEIRRGKEEQAMFWALELGERYMDYVWQRLLIISNEDVGLAAPRTILLVNTLHDQYEKIKKKKGTGWRMMLANAVLALCRAPKTRLADSFACAMTHRRDTLQVRPEVPDYALDAHTKRGKAKGRGLEHWRTEGCRVVGDAGLDIYEEEAFQYRALHGKISHEPPVESKGALPEFPAPLFSEDGEPREV